MKIKVFIDKKYTTNTYLIEKNNKVIVIDPAGNYQEINQYLKTINRQLDLVLLTHGHYDHLIDLNMFIEDNIPIYIDSNDLVLLNSNKRGGCLLLKIKDFTISDIIFDFIKIIKTPGHTLGSVMYLIEDNLFSGDTLFKDDIGRTDLFNSSPQKMHETIKLILNLPNYTVYPGHGEKTNINAEKNFLTSNL